MLGIGQVSTLDLQSEKLLDIDFRDVDQLEFHLDKVLTVTSIDLLGYVLVHQEVKHGNHKAIQVCLDLIHVSQLLDALLALQIVRAL